MSGWKQTPRAAGIMLGVSIVLNFVSGCTTWSHSVQASNETAAVLNLKTIANVEIQYFNTHGRSFGTFDQMVAEQMLDRRFAGATPTVNGYIFTLKVTPKTDGQKASYTLNADPESRGTGTKHFFIDSFSGEIHANSDRPASAADPVAGS